VPIREPCSRAGLSATAVADLNVTPPFGLRMTDPRASESRCFAQSRTTGPGAIVFEPSPARMVPTVVGPMWPGDFDPRVQSLLAGKPELLIQLGSQRSSLLLGRAARFPLDRVWTRGTVTQTPVSLREAGITPGLANRSVGVVGLGSLGSRVAERLAAAGVGRLVVVDPDYLEPSNIRRHLCGVEHVGRPKVEAVVDELSRRGFPTDAVPIARAAQREAADDAREALSECDLLLCLTDSSAAQHFVNHLGVHLKRPVVIGSVQLMPEPLGEVVMVSPGHGGCFNCWRLQLEHERRLLRAEHHDPEDYPGPGEPTPSGLPLYQLDFVASAVSDLANLSSGTDAESLIWLMPLDRFATGFPDIRPRRVSLESLQRQRTCLVC